MCGIAGLVELRDNRPADLDQLKIMTDRLHHRGPDGSGYHTDGSVGLGHRRLSIIDIATGDQPMFNEDGNVCVVFNGEIYNFQSLVAELESMGHTFRTRSDTEVLVHGWEQWGPACVERLNGMYAFAVWDRAAQTLFIARDRLGIKPLYYSFTDSGQFLFGSELKALQSHPALNRQLDNRAVMDYFTVGYAPDPRTIYAKVHKLPPAHWLKLDCRTGQHRVDAYWDIDYSHMPGNARDEAEIQQELVERLHESVRLQLVSDVPLGAFLSGGVDSSAVVSMMADLVPDQVRTCAIGFDEADFDESIYAEQVAELLHTRHTKRSVRVDDFDLVDHLVDVYDEPYADSSAIPTYRLCEATRDIVKVALSGDGGDENFAGYRRYQLFAAEEAVRSRIPAAIRQPVFGFLGRYYPKLDWAPRVFRGKTTFQALARDSVGAYLHGVSTAPEEVRERLFSASLKRDLNGYSTLDHFDSLVAEKTFPDSLSMVQYLDFKTYLPGDILTKVDRASMAHSLEVRVPLLDHEFVAWVAQLPSSLKLRRFEGKYIFKKSLEDRLPHDILYRRKMGFAVPLQRWFRGPLADRVQGLKSSAALLDSGLFEADGLRFVVDRHISGKRDYSAMIWSLLMFEGFQARR